MGQSSNEIERADLKPGDHIFTWRKFHIYAHHGIYVGDSKVIHFNAARGQRMDIEAVADLFGKETATTQCKVCGGRKERTENGVKFSCLDCFLAGGKLYRYQYATSWPKYLIKERGGTCNPSESDAPEVVLERATTCLQDGFKKYNLAFNNCEDFAIFCKTGKKKLSGQTVQLLETAAKTAVAVAGSAAAAVIYEKYQKKKKKKEKNNVENMLK